MVKNRKVVHWAIAEYPQAQQSAVHGIKELADSANQHSSSSKPRLDVSICDLSTRTPRHKSDYGVVILPPCLSQSPPTLQDSNNALEWLKRCHHDGALICSVCSGSFILAETGLLDERSATTHWLYAAIFREMFPQVNLQFDRLIDHQGNIMTAGGLMAWTDLSLYLIELFHGTRTMLDVSRLFLLEPGLRQQKHYASFVPKRNHGDDKILLSQRSIEDQLAKKWSIASLAQHVGLTERTFLRRFKCSTGFNPTQYLQQIRMDEARRELEMTTRSIDQVAYHVGYTDTPAFNRIFKKIVGLPPGIYRKRYSLNER